MYMYCTTGIFHGLQEITDWNFELCLPCCQPMDKNMTCNANSNLVRNYHSSLSFTFSSSSLPPPSHLDSLSSLSLIGIHFQAATFKNLVALPIGLYWWCQLIKVQ